ncbi:AAA family ATPase [Bosea sp. UNC402CLCol]|uniref:AAA family ATPase n=1 Tax=Bosea sp. UNC402CLCol TaxID=1510531 RepID=UPI0012E0BA6D
MSLEWLPGPNAGQQKGSLKRTITVIAATNHSDRIDPAVKRAGRLDRDRPSHRAAAFSLRRRKRNRLQQEWPEAGSSFAYSAACKAGASISCRASGRLPASFRIST